jgi:hypothetical protein
LRLTGALVVGIALSPLSVGSAFAQGAVQTQVSVYTGANAVGYLQPLANAFGATLNSALGYSAYIPRTSFHLSLEAPVMGVIFEDTDRTFEATTEVGFIPSTTQIAPTAVGSGDAVTVIGNGGASFAFPGGLDLHSFGLVVPQLRVSSLAGTEAVVRWIAFDKGDSDIGNIALFGIGGRHSLSQYMGEAPVLDMAIGALWQTFKVGENDQGRDFCSTEALSVQLQASRRFPVPFVLFEPYATLAWEKLDVDLEYDGPDGEPVRIALEGQNEVRFTIGGGFNFKGGHVWADYSVSHTDNFSFGLALGNLGRTD